MRTLHIGLRVRDRDRSLTFYRALGYEVVGSIPETGIGHLTMLKLPGDEFVTIELVSGSPDGPFRGTTGLNHLVVQVESLAETISTLADQGIEADQPADQNPEGIRTTWITDPDGNRIELVQWPPGHAQGMSAADWPDEDGTPRGESA